LSSRFVVGVLFRKIIPRSVEPFWDPHVRRVGWNASPRSGRPQGEGCESQLPQFRHTTTSLLKNAGVSPAIAEEFVGHDSAEMNRVYTHIELDAMKKAAGLLPDVTAGL